MSLFSSNLRFLRKKGNYNQDEISRLFNKQANTIGNWENQKSEPSIAELMKLGEYFNVSLQELILIDLETKFSRHNTEVTNSDAVNKPYPLLQPGPSLTNEGGQDALWLILRELKTVSQKVDLLVSQIGLNTSNKSSDKSSH